MGAPALRAGAPSQRRPAPFGRWPPPKKKVYNGKWYSTKIFCRGFPNGKRDILGSYRLKRKSVPGNGLGGKGYSGLEGMSGCKDDLPPFSAVGGIRA
jgi:hypothetical protein